MKYAAALHGKNEVRDTAGRKSRPLIYELYLCTDFCAFRVEKPFYALCGTYHFVAYLCLEFC